MKEFSCARSTFGRTAKLLAVLTVCGLLPAASYAQPPAQRQSDSKKNQKNHPDVLAAFRPVVAKPSQSTVKVISGDKEVALGTIVGPDGWILTKASELKGPVTVSLKDGRSFPAKLVGVEEHNDVAMLKIDANNLTPVTWTESKVASVGYWVASPGTGDEPVGIGVVSVAARKLPPSPMNMVANSGFLGVVLEPPPQGVKISKVEENSAAAKAGFKTNDIITGIGDTEVRDLESYTAALKKIGTTAKEVKVHVRRGETDEDLTVKLGIQGLEGATLQTAQKGSLIQEVSPNTAASKAGLKPQDLVLEMNGKPIRDTDALMGLLRATKPGQSITLKVRRGDKELELKATLGRRESMFDRSDFQNRMGSTLSERRAGFTVILQHDTVLRAQDCGGPLVDLDGHVIGINIARAGRVESYALPAEVVQPLLADLMSGKLAPKTQLTSTATPEERLRQAKAHLATLESQKADLEKQLADARAAVADAEAAVKAQKEAEKEKGK
jgi:S1-C subfamily serine protease